MAGNRPYSSRFKHGSETYRRERRKELERQQRRALSLARAKRTSKAARTKALAQARRAKYALWRVGVGYTAEVVIDGERREVRPASAEDGSKIGRYMNLLARMKRTGNYEPVRNLSKEDLTIRTTEGTIRLEGDPLILEDMDLLGELDIDEVMRYSDKAAA